MRRRAIPSPPPLSTNFKSLQYNNSLGKHRFGILVGNTLQQATLGNLTASGYNFPNNAYTLISQAASQTAQQSLDPKQAGLIFSPGSTITYASRNIGIWRRPSAGTGSSKFASGHQWGYFPSIGASWNARSEDFLAGATALSDLRFRGELWHHWQPGWDRGFCRAGAFGIPVWVACQFERRPTAGYGAVPVTEPEPYLGARTAQTNVVVRYEYRVV